MKHPLCQLEFAVGSLEDIKVLLKVWQRIVVLEGLQDSLAKFVHVVIEDREPGEEVRLVFTAEQRVMEQFLSSLTDFRFGYHCQDLIPEMLTECRVTRDRGVLRAMGSNSQLGLETEGVKMKSK